MSVSAMQSWLCVDHMYVCTMFYTLNFVCMESAGIYCLTISIGHEDEKLVKLLCSVDLNLSQSLWRHFGPCDRSSLT